jgi:hypothetical protein
MSFVVLAVLGLAGPVAAHHSFAVHFVPDKQISVTGVVTEFRFANPHGLVFFEVKKDHDEVEKWRAETNSPSLLQRRGWSRSSIKPGDKITIVGWPARDGSPFMRIDKIVFSDGRELSSRGPSEKPAE